MLKYIVFIWLRANNFQTPAVPENTFQSRIDTHAQQIMEKKTENKRIMTQTSKYKETRNVREKNIPLLGLYL